MKNLISLVVYAVKWEYQHTRNKTLFLYNFPTHVIFLFICFCFDFCIFGEIFYRLSTECWNVKNEFYRSRWFFFLKRTWENCWKIVVKMHLKKTRIDVKRCVLTIKRRKIHFKKMHCKNATYAERDICRIINDIIDQLLRK